MRGKIYASIVLVLAVTALAAPVHAAEDVLGVDVYPDRAPTTNASERVVLEGYEPGERYNWTVTVADEYDVLDLTVHDGFDVDRARQLVPLLDGEHFVELHTVNVTEVDQPAKVFNLTSTEDGWRYRLGLPDPGPKNLTLHRDVTPPTVEMGPVRNVTHYSFDVQTSTSEPALAELVLEKPDGTNRTQPTPSPGIWQRFPVQGLEPVSTYRFHVEVWDWSGNRAETGEETVTTAAEPIPPKPTVEVVRPAPNATVPGTDGVVLEATFESPDSPVPADGFAVFFDKREVDHRNVTVDGNTVQYVVEGPLTPRMYFASVEVTNEAGGTGIARWSFTVEGTPQADSPLGLEVALIALAAVAGLGRAAGVRRR